MISFIVRFQFRPEDRASVGEHLRMLSEATRQEPGCVNYIGHFVVPEHPVPGDPESVLIYEQYRAEPDLEHHRNTEHFRVHAANGLYTLMLSREMEHLQAVC